MSEFSKQRFPPGFFDLPQRAGETLPLEVISAWTGSDQGPDLARAILAPYLRRGTVVCSDSAGLTRLGRERPLIEILAMIGHPKEIIHAHGRAIGGRAIGVWAADNTQMYYDGDLDVARVVAMLRTTMERIAADCELRIGMAAHVGEFYELSGAVYGPDADRVEAVAEEHTAGGELVVSSSVASALPATHGFALQPRGDLDARFGQFLRVTGGPTLAGLDTSDVRYPAPYSSDFSEDIAVYTHLRRDSRIPRQAHQDLAVVLIEREPASLDTPEVAVLDNLALTAAMKRMGLALLDAHAGHEVKNSGLIGIYTFADCRVAIDFARQFRQSLLDQGLRCRIGIDAGFVLVFELAPGSHDIAGSAVNVASKLAQDVGEYGVIQISDEVARRANAARDRPTRTFTVSGVELRAYDV